MARRSILLGRGKFSAAGEEVLSEGWNQNCRCLRIVAGTEEHERGCSRLHGDYLVVEAVWSDGFVYIAQKFHPMTRDEIDGRDLAFL